jgi:carbamoyl-phosphate synthase large subunit
MRRIGLEVPHGGFAHSLDEAIAVAEKTGFPAIVRPSFTLGGTGGGIAYNREEFEQVARAGLEASPIGEILIDKSVIGWKEYELEVMRDHADNVVIVCSIENFDAMGVHTGDSITVAPAMTLSDAEYQILRDGAIACIREIGVAAGGCTVNGEVLVIEMNPRVSRSSALASKATGFPIARIGTKLAVGYRLDELPNEITKQTPASFEPVLDYVVVKVPRFAFEKFPSADPVLGIQMKAVGEVMAIGRTFKEAWMKGFRSLENGRSGWECGDTLADDGLAADDRETLLAALRRPTADRYFQIKRALRIGLAVDEINAASHIDPWFLEQLEQLVKAEVAYSDLDEPTREATWEMKRLGFSDSQLGRLRGEGESDVRERRWGWEMHPSFKMVDTCAGEFPAATPYLYSTYEEENESVRSDRRKVVVLGSGPNRIGQGVEFDYCCVSAAFALAEEGFETIMVNSNPETVSTDFDVSDKLYFEPLTLEDVLEIVQLEKPDGVVVQMGGQTPLKLAGALRDLGVPILGTSVESIDRAEDRERFEALARELGIDQPANGLAMSEAEAIKVANRIGYPALVRPSYVLGGRAMEIVYDEESLKGYFERAVRASPEHPVLIDRFLEDAFEADVDAVSDGDDVMIGGVMQHIEDAGIHSGDSACVVPPYLLRDEHVERMREYARSLAQALGVVGLINVQFAVKDGTVYVLEVNPRASRTVPFLSKATGVPLARLAARCMVGRKLAEFDLPDEPELHGVAVKESVFPFEKLPGVDSTLGNPLPLSGRIVVTVHDQDKANATPIVRRFHELGFEIWATANTARYLRARGIPTTPVLKVHEGRPHIVDHLISGDIDLLINTPLGKHAQYDDYEIRRAAIQRRIPYTTTLSAASALCDAVIALRHRKLQVLSLQERAERSEKIGV